MTEFSKLSLMRRKGLLEVRRASLASEMPLKHPSESISPLTVTQSPRGKHYRKTSAISLDAADQSYKQPEEEWIPDVPAAHSSVPHHGFSKNSDWIIVQRAILDVFQFKSLPVKEIEFTCSKVRNLMKTDLSHHIHEYFQKQLLPRGRRMLRESIEEDSLLETLEEVWQVFYTQILPDLMCILHPVPFRDLDTRSAALVDFRDGLLLKFNVEVELDQPGVEISPAIRQMLLVLQSVMETHPPNDNFIRLERLVARAVVPYLGYLGLYEGGPVPTIRSVNRAVQPAIRRPSEDLQTHVRGLAHMMSLTTVAEKSPRSSPLSIPKRLLNQVRARSHSFSSQLPGRRESKADL